MSDRFTGIPEAPDRKLPFSEWWAVAVGAMAGLFLRLVYSGGPDEAFATMLSGFVVFTPMFVGVVTVYVAEREKRRTWGYYAVAGALANTLVVIGAMAILIEGLICAIVIVPLFASFGAFGGVLMGAVCRYTNWPRRTLYAFAALPLLLGPVEGRVPFAAKTGVIERSVVVAASPDAVWRRLLDAPDIRAGELEHAWMFRIGVPVTESGRMLPASSDRVRRVTMGKNIYFDEVITDWREREYLRWTYRYYEDSFPPHALDDHVKLGGHYFDITDTSYTLTREGEQTRLDLRLHYRVSTRFNWYADPVARLLLGNLAEVNLDFYRGRSEGRS